MQLDDETKQWLTKLYERAKPDIESSDVFIAVIGPHAVGDIDPQGALELGVALQLGKKIYTIAMDKAEIGDGLRRVSQQVYEGTRENMSEIMRLIHIHLETQERVQ